MMEQWWWCGVHGCPHPPDLHEVENGVPTPRLWMDIQSAAQATTRASCAEALEARIASCEHNSAGCCAACYRALAQSWREA